MKKGLANPTQGTSLLVSVITKITWTCKQASVINGIGACTISLFKTALPIASIILYWSDPRLDV